MALSTMIISILMANFLLIAHCTTTANFYFDFTQISSSTYQILDQTNTASSSRALNTRANGYERVTAWGLPMTGQVVYNTQSALLHITSSSLSLTGSFSFSGWYYSCGASSYTVFCKSDPTTSPENRYICLQVNANGYYIITVRLSGNDMQYQTQTVQAQSGWMWFGLTVNNVFMYTTVTLYAASDAYFPAGTIKSESYTFPYAYMNTVSGNLMGNTYLTVGCRVNAYGNCMLPMSGYFYEFKIWSSTSLTSALISTEVSTTCTSVTSSTCNVCSTAKNICFSSFSLEVLDLDLENDNQSIQNLTNNVFTFTQGQTSTVDANDPIRIQNQGFRFSKSSYLYRNVPASPIPLAGIITIEAWIRFDVNNYNTLGSHAHIYQAVRNTQKLSFGVDNTQLKLSINSNLFSYPVNWLSNSNWRYVAASISRVYLDSASSNPALGVTNVALYLDQYLASTGTISSFFVDDTSVSTLIYDYIGWGFHGVIRKVRITNNPLCGVSQTPSVSTSCGSFDATTTCNICDSSTFKCFSACPFNTFDSWCSPCDWTCQYCQYSSTSCLACNSASFLTGTAPTCKCALDYTQVGSTCQKCHPNCALCIDTTNYNCPACSASAYLLAGTNCASLCPYGYLQNSNQHLCHFDTSSLIQPVYQLNAINANCATNQYLSSTYICLNCDSSCYTCNAGTSSDCTSCPLNKYLYRGQCLPCSSSGMFVGSSGQCVEICGDGLNFGLYDCDDKNTINGDGCSSTCLIEQGWSCSGGSSTSKDTCQYEAPYIQSLIITHNNNLVLLFTEQMIITDVLTGDDFDITIQNPDTSFVNDFSVSFSTIQEIPTTRLYIQLTVGEFLQGLNQESEVTVTYLGTQKIFNYFGEELITNATGIAYMKENTPFLSDKERLSIKAVAVYCNIVVVLVIMITVVTALKYYDYPLNMQSLWKHFSWVSLEFTIIPNIFQEYLMDMNQIKTYSYSDNFQFLSKQYSTIQQSSNFTDFTADSFLINNCFKIYLWFVYCLSFLFVMCFARRCCFRKRQAILDSYLFSGTISFYMCCMLPFGYSTFIEIQSMGITLPSKLISVCTSFYMMSIQFFFLYSMFMTALNGFHHIHNHKLTAKYKSLFHPFKKTKICLLFYPIFCAKRFIQIVFTVIYLDSAQNQTIFNAVIQIAFFIYLLAARPFQQVLNNLMIIIAEGLATILILLTFMFQSTSNDPQQAYMYGWGPIAILALYCTVQFLMGIAANIVDVLYRSQKQMIRRYEIKDKDKAEKAIKGKLSMNLGQLLAGLKKEKIAKEAAQNQQNDANLVNLKPMGVTLQPTQIQATPINQQQPLPQNAEQIQQMIQNNMLMQQQQRQDNIQQQIQPPEKQQELTHDDKKQNPTNLPVLSQQQRPSYLPAIDNNKNNFNSKALITPSNVNQFGVDMDDGTTSMVDTKRKTKKLVKKKKSKKGTTARGGNFVDTPSKFDEDHVLI